MPSATLGSYRITAAGEIGPTRHILGKVLFLATSIIVNHSRECEHYFQPPLALWDATCR